MSTWIRFFLGTPRRFLRTLIGAIIVAALIKPQSVVDAMNALWLAFQPIIGLAITIAIVVVALRLIVGKK